MKDKLVTVVLLPLIVYSFIFCILFLLKDNSDAPVLVIESDEYDAKFPYSDDGVIHLHDTPKQPISVLNSVDIGVALTDKYTWNDADNRFEVKDNTEDFKFINSEGVEVYVCDIDSQGRCFINSRKFGIIEMGISNEEDITDNTQR